MKLTRFLLTAVSSLLLVCTAQAQTLKIGASAGVHADTLAAAVAEAKKAGLDVKIVEFTDWTRPTRP